MTRTQTILTVLAAMAAGCHEPKSEPVELAGPPPAAVSTAAQPAPEAPPEPATPPPLEPALDSAPASEPADAGLSEEARHAILLRAEKLLKERHKIGQQQNAAKCLDGSLRESGNCPKGPPRAKVIANRKAWKELLGELGDDPEVPDLKRRWRDTTIEGRYKRKYE